MPKTIGNPLSWTFGALGSAAGYATDIATQASADPDLRLETRRLVTGDLRRALRKGWDDLSAMRSDVLFACMLYPAIGAVLLAFAARGNLTHLLFPVLSGFALVGPVAALGLYELSRRREAGQEVGWGAMFDVLRNPRFPRILMLGLFNGVIFMVWLLLADAIHAATLGSDRPASLTALVTAALTTPAGWVMTVVGTAVGFVLAAAVLAVSAISFPLLLDRNVSLPVAVMTSVRVARENPVVIAIWGLIVTGGLVLGILPLLLGLVVVLPVLGHATWHLYRAAVV
ncbi:DUF2189 domain-containing protein [Tabrizicola sp.]|jgi:uncharacterized membrane protein|uniref:DUF2189 domain-containing protein n=1 Tax=Tabrizicola sp. TaxID=2005166 RepID=UPI0025E91A25|nr:DUF2189 domain-containing protein [Tabrizicola sp.]MBY0349383.1 DUF2189 domain-containing protein [Tabrizicola sp.]MDK2774506.1 DUF2189 domain-containing protein [Tabrizicola sp.]